MLEKFFESNNWSNFLISLEIMWKGMLAIFIVLSIISIIVLIMTKLQKNNVEDQE